MIDTFLQGVMRTDFNRQMLNDIVVNADIFNISASGLGLGTRQAMLHRTCILCVTIGNGKSKAWHAELSLYNVMPYVQS